MVTIGLTGSLATGKSTVAAIFRRLGAKVINADSIVHQLIAPQGACYNKVIKVFGDDIVDRGRINRKKLADIVFKSKAKRKKLEAIIHPKVKSLIRKELKKYRKTKQKIILEVPLLFEAGLNRFVDATVVVKASQANQLKRAKQQFRMTKAEALRRIRAQWPLDKKIRLADFTIDNNGTKKQTEKQVKSLWQKL